MYSSTRALVSATTEVDYFLQPPNEDQPLLIFLHGFGETYGHMMRHFRSHLPDGIGVLAVNGVFPLPQKKFDSPEWKLRFCWYFYDSAKKEYFIDQRYPAEVLSGLISKLGFESNKKIIIGYSQGGYLAPFLGSVLDNVSTCIAINAEYKVQMLPKKLPFHLINICGENDEVVDPINCQRSHQQMIQQGNSGSFEHISGQGHSISPEVVEKTLKHAGISTT